MTHLDWDERLVLWIGIFTIAAWLLTASRKQVEDLAFAFLLFIGAPLLVWGAIKILAG